ncbi:MAG: hypothetical protein ABIC04_02595 [Nanoarchaeota archaeon]
MDGIYQKIRNTVDDVAQALEEGKRNPEDFRPEDPLYSIFQSVRARRAHPSFVSFIQQYITALNDEQGLGSETGIMVSLRKAQLSYKKKTMISDCASAAHTYMLGRDEEMLNNFIDAIVDGAKNLRDKNRT